MTVIMAYIGKTVTVRNFANTPSFVVTGVLQDDEKSFGFPGLHFSVVSATAEVRFFACNIFSIDDAAIPTIRIDIQDDEDLIRRDQENYYLGRIIKEAQKT